MRFRGYGVAMTLERNLTRATRRAERALILRPLHLLDRVVVPVLGSDSVPHRVIVRSARTIDAVVSRFAPRPPSRPTLDRTRVQDRAEAYLDAQGDEVFTGELADDEIRRVQAEVRAKQALEDEQAR